MQENLNVAWTQTHILRLVGQPQRNFVTSLQVETIHEALGIGIYVTLQCVHSSVSYDTTRDTTQGYPRPKPRQ